MEESVSRIPMNRTKEPKTVVVLEKEKNTHQQELSDTGWTRKHIMNRGKKEQEGNWEQGEYLQARIYDTKSFWKHINQERTGERRDKKEHREIGSKEKTCPWESMTLFESEHINQDRTEERKHKKEQGEIKANEKTHQWDSTKQWIGKHINRDGAGERNYRMELGETGGQENTRPWKSCDPVIKSDGVSARVEQGDGRTITKRRKEWKEDGNYSPISN